MSLLSHDRYQYDSLILSKQTWAYPPQHLKQLLWCVVSVRLNSPEVEERKLCLWYTPTSRNHKELSLDLQHNVESVYFFYSNPVFISDYMVLTPGMSRQIASFSPLMRTVGHFALCPGHILKQHVPTYASACIYLALLCFLDVHASGVTEPLVSRLTTASWWL